MDPSIWRTLAIEPTADLAEIRRAYAAKLKLANPEDNAEAFKKLRAAYETAVKWARRGTPHAAPTMPAPSAPAPPPAVRAAPREAQESAAPDLPIDPEIDELHKAFDALRAALAPSGGSSDGRAAAALDTFLKSPALANVSLTREAEWRLANLLAATIPRSDPLLLAAAKRFGWLNEALRAPPTVHAVLGRLNDLAFLETVQAKGSAYASAFRGLQRRKIPIWSWLRAHVHMTGKVGEHQLLQMIRLQHPGLISMLNPDTIAWWDRLASRPQISFALLVVAFAGGGFVLSVGWSADVLAPGLWTFGLCFGAALWKLYLLDWPRHWLRTKWPVICPARLASGWLPLAVLCLVTAVVAPGTATLVVIALCALAIQWALIVRTTRLSGNPRNDWIVDFVIPQGVLAFWWVGITEQLPAGTLEPMLIPSFSLMVASGLGALTLRAVWMRQITLSQRRAIATMLALLLITAAALLWWLTPDAKWHPACAALVLIVVVLHRPLTCALTEDQQKARGIWALVGVIVLILASVLEPTASVLKARGLVFVGGGLVLLATSAFSAALMARTDLRAAKNA